MMIAPMEFFIRESPRERYWYVRGVVIQSMVRDIENGLIISPNFHNYGDIITETLSARGITTTHFPYPSQEESFPEKLYYYILRHTKFRNHRYGGAELQLKRNWNLIEAFNETIRETISRETPDFVLVIQGAYVKPETVRWIRDETDSTPILWCYDEIDRLRLVHEGARYYETAFLFQPPSSSELAGDVNAEYLPLAHADSNYRKVDTSAPSIDVSFVGSLVDDRRKEILSYIIKELDANVAVWYPAWTWKNPVSLYQYKMKYRELDTHINRTFIDHSTVNDVYNRSKICLNIHKIWKVNADRPVGLNMRTFEVPGSGGFQLVDKVTNIGSHYEIGEEVVTYADKADLIEKIRYYLENEAVREKIATRGHERAKAEHTYEDRLDTILESL
jgi:spore maturation protein CgeB